MLRFSVTGLAGNLLRRYGLMALYEVYWTTVKVLSKMLSQWYGDVTDAAPSPEYTGSGDYRSSAPGGSAQGPSSRLTVAYHKGPGAVSGQKCARSHRCAVST